MRNPHHLDTAQESMTGLDFLSLLSPNQKTFFSGIMRSACLDKSVKSADGAILLCRRQLHKRVCQAWGEAESSAYAVTLSLTESQRPSCEEYAAACWVKFRLAVVEKQRQQKVRRAA